jgi:hypothetical protein
MQPSNGGGAASMGGGRERGISLIGFLLLMAVGSFVILFVVRVAPIYFDHYLIKSTIESLNKDPNLQSKSREEILGLLQNRWDINNIETVKKKDVKLSREEGSLKLQLKYEVSRNVYANLDVVVRFDDEFVFPPKP